ncbi:hypothetical protein SAY86_017340 [Trapa natans]|uniref:Alfin N-terminal domain-containing protein n=1 Tax=Trapa natans TaxID=22666 RepID=A0AAN7R7C0_TRANT|nr:hypothetical protein SAY86_017340 [Trapa natans]
MDGGVQQYSPRTVEEVFQDFKGRRAGLIKALTTGQEEKLLKRFLNQFGILLFSFQYIHELISA